MSLTQLNKKQLESIPDASTSVKGIVEMATDTEATTGTDETRYINPKQAKDNYSYNISEVNDIIIDEILTEYTNPASGSFIQIGGTIRCMFMGSIRVTYDMSSIVGGSSSYTARVQVGKNGVGVGPINTKNGGDSTWSSYTTDISVDFGDNIRLFLNYGRIRNLRVRGKMTTGKLFTYTF